MKLNGPKFWQALRFEGAISNRYLPMRIYVLFGKMVAALVAAAFTVTALWGHYGNLVEGQSWIGRLCAGFPEMVMISLCFVPIFSGYEDSGDLAEKWYNYLMYAVLIHAGLIYSSAFVDRQIDKKIAKRYEQVERVTQTKRVDDLERDKAASENSQAALERQAADIRRAAEDRAKKNEAQGNRKMAGWIRSNAEAQIQALYKNANKSQRETPSDFSSPNIEDEVKRRRDEVIAEMSSGWFGRAMMSFKAGADIYLESFFAIIVPFLIASIGLGKVYKQLRADSKHEEAAAGKIRTPAAKGAYRVPGTQALDGWTSDKPPVGQPTRRFTADMTPEMAEYLKNPPGGEQRH